MVNPEGCEWCGQAEQTYRLADVKVSLTMVAERGLSQAKIYYHCQ